MWMGSRLAPYFLWLLLQGRWQKKTGIITRARVFHTTGEMQVQILYYQEKENAILQRRGSIHFGG
jgi:hypothetical protein